MFVRIIAEVVLTLLLLGFLAHLAVRYVPPLRRAWQRANGRRLEESAFYYCRTHGDIPPMEAVISLTGSIQCPVCYSTLLKQELGNA